MDLPASQALDDFLTKLPQPDAATRQVRSRVDQSEDVALGRRRIPAQEQVGTAEVEEAQGMRLNDLTQVHQPTKFLSRRRNGHRQDAVAGLAGRDQVADRTDATDAGARPAISQKGRPTQNRSKPRNSAT